MNMCAHAAIFAAALAPGGSLGRGDSLLPPGETVVFLPRAVHQCSRATRGAWEPRAAL